MGSELSNKSEKGSTRRRKDREERGVIGDQKGGRFGFLWNRGNDKPKKEQSKKADIKTLYKPLRNEQLIKTKEEIQKKYEKYYNKWRDYDLLTSILSMTGLVIAIIDHEYNLTLKDYDPRNPLHDSYVRMIITVTSLLAIVSITLRHYQKTQWLNYELPKELQQEVYSLKVFDNTWKKERKRQFLSKSYFVEVLLISIHPLPYWDPVFSVESINLTDRTKYVTTYYRLSHVLLALMFIRCVLLLRTIFNYSTFTDLYSKKLCESYGFTANVRFTFKCLIIRDPGLTVVCTLAASTLIVAYILRIFEIEYYRSIH